MAADKAQQSVPSTDGASALLSLQALRGIATTIVIIAHVQLYVSDKLKLPDLMPFYGVVAAAVDSFFIVSGFIMVYASERLFGRASGMRIFFLRRAARILPMYWITSTFVLVYILLQYKTLEAAGTSITHVIGSYLFVPLPRLDGSVMPLHGVAWTLNYEVLFYVIFGSLVMLSRRRIVVACIVLFSAIVCTGLIFGPFPNPWEFWSYPLILEFVLGMILGLAYREGVRLPVWAVRTLFLAGCLALLWSGTEGHFFDPAAGARLIVWGIPTFFIVAALTLTNNPLKPTPFWRFWSFLGDASYSLYLIHTLTITLPRLFLLNIIAPASAPWFYVSSMMVLAFVPGILVYVYFEKPLLAYLQRKIEGDRRPAAPLQQAVPAP